MKKTIGDDLNKAAIKLCKKHNLRNMIIICTSKHGQNIVKSVENTMDDLEKQE